MDSTGDMSGNMSGNISGNMSLDSKTVKILTWKDVKKKVLSLNPSLGAEIDRVKGVDDFKVIVATYPFGAPIIRKGLFFLNLDGDFPPSPVIIVLEGLSKGSGKIIPPSL